MENQFELIQQLEQSLSLSLHSDMSREKLEAIIAEYINHLILHDFESLINILYRLDVDESKLRFVLDKNKGDDASLIIAQMIIERQLQKNSDKKNLYEIK